MQFASVVFSFSFNHDDQRSRLLDGRGRGRPDASFFCFCFFEGEAGPGPGNSWQDVEPKGVRERENESARLGTRKRHGEREREKGRRDGLCIGYCIFIRRHISPASSVFTSVGAPPPRKCRGQTARSRRPSRDPRRDPASGSKRPRESYKKSWFSAESLDF